MEADIATNRRARHEYHILETVEAGIELRGTEVKSIRGGLANLDHAYARVENREVILHQLDIQPYERASHEQHEPRRPRRLLLHRREIDRLFGQNAVEGRSLIPLKIYWKQSRVKVLLGVAKGKAAPDKRQDIKRRTETREAEREVARFQRGKR